MASMPSRGEGKDGNNDSERLPSGHQAEGREREAEGSPSFLQQWTDHIFFARAPTDWLNTSSCGGAACLSQVDDRGDVNSGDANTNTANDDQAVPPSYGVDPEDTVDFSLLDHDESTADPSRDGTRSLGRDRSLSLDSTYRDDNHSPDNEGVCEVVPGVEVSTSECCPICLHAMSPYDLMYPMKCGVSTCSYNFCEECMSSLLSASKEDYQLASDGSRRLKIQLKCPNCRADIADIIEDVIEIRRDAFKADLELDSKPQAKSAEVPILGTSDTKPPSSDDSPDTSALPVSPFKNRSSASRQGHKKRIQELIETVESMPTPSQSRDQVLVIHGHHFSSQDQGSTSSASHDDNQSQSSSSSSVDVRIDQPPSLFRSRRRSFTSSIAGATTSSSTPAKSQSNVQPPSPKLSQLVTPKNLRRTQSMQTTPPRSMSVNKPSPRSVFDLDYYSFRMGHSDTTDGSRRGKTKSEERGNNITPPRLTKSKSICLEGISFADGGGFFAKAIDLGWCCHDSTAPTTITTGGIDLHGGEVIDAPSSSSKGEGCGGYVDYSGIYHPCTEVEHESDDKQGSVQWDGPCQGCIFRRGMHMPDDERVGEEEELYYDSDPGQHFAKDRWEPRSAIKKDDSLDAAEGDNTSVGSSATPRRRAKLRWRRRKSKRSKLLSKSDGSDSDSSQDISKDQDDNRIPEDSLQQQRQEDQQAYLYDYFSRTDRSDANAMRTGICLTDEREAGAYVQEALNSKWSLQWHVNITKSSKGRSQQSQQLPPKMCEVWIERGFRRNRTEIVEPKLMWREVSQPNLRDKRQLGGSTMRPYRVSLFAIRRIFQADNDSDFEKKMSSSEDRLDVQGLTKQAFLPPMAKPNCLLRVRSSLGEDFIFEASCPEERDHIIHLLKIATARLVSHAVVGNGDLMIKEFFNEDCIEGGLYASLPSSEN